jgi:phosphinothricin acetyltransferase
MLLRQMKPSDWEDVADIYWQGIKTGIATFESQLPDFKTWDERHHETGRLVAVDGDGRIIGWTSLSPVSARAVYGGVAEVSIYVGEAHRGRGVGIALLEKLIAVSEENGFWTLQSTILQRNSASITLHQKAGFVLVGVRKNIARDICGQWQSAILMERRSETVGIL